MANITDMNGFAQMEKGELMRDLIDRQIAIDAIEPTLKSILQGNSFKAINVIDKIRDLPPAEPKKGKWLPDNTDIRMYYVCSECKQATQIPTYVGGFLYNYCPNCGADMRGEQDDEMGS